MTRDELAALLNGRAYRHEISREEEAQAKAAGLLVIFGASDDLVEFRGTIHDEIDALDGAVFRLCKDGGLLPDWESLRIADSDEPERDAEVYFTRKALGFHELSALWDHEGFSWVIKTDLPHTPFVILDDGDNYCRGVVLDVAEITGQPKPAAEPAAPAAPELVYSHDEEDYSHDLDTVLDRLRSDYEEAELVGKPYWVGEKVQEAASFFFRGAAQHVIDRAADIAYDSNEHAEDFCSDVKKEARAELQALIEAWADKHVGVNFWTVKNVRKLEVTAEDIETAKADDIALNADYLEG
jgi:hypothetical protein